MGKCDRKLFAIGLSIGFYVIAGFQVWMTRLVQAQPASEANTAQPASEANSSQSDTEAQRALEQKQERDTLRRNLELARLSKLTDGWRGKTYHSVRQKPAEALSKGLLLAAKKANETDWENLPDAAKQAALSAHWVSKQLTGKQHVKESGEPDWLAMHQTIEVAMQSNNRRWREVMAMTWLSLGQRFLALMEMESAHIAYKKEHAEAVQDVSVQDIGDEIGHRMLRGVVLALNGLSQLSLDELEHVADRLNQIKDVTNVAETAGLKDDVLRASSKASGYVADWLKEPRVHQGLNMLIAYIHLSHSELAQADFVLGKISEKYPNNPLTVFLTGQRHLENGEVAAAEKSLEKVLADTKYQWLGETVSTRVAAARENPDMLKPMVIDPVLLGDMIKAFLVNSALESGVIREFWEPYKGMSELKDELEGKLRRFDFSGMFGKQKATEDESDQDSQE